MLVGEPTPVKFTLTNDTANDYYSYWKIAAVESTTGLLNRVIKLNNEEPGAEVFGYTPCAPEFECGRDRRCDLSPATG